MNELAKLLQVQVTISYIRIVQLRQSILGRFEGVSIATITKPLVKRD